MIRGASLPLMKVRLLFDAVQQRLEKLVAVQHAESDHSVELLCELLGLSSTDKSLLTLCCALEIGTIGSSPFAQAQRPSRQIDALRAGLQLDSQHAVRAALGAQSPLMRSGLLNWDGRGRRDLEDVLKLSRQGSALMGSKVRSPLDMAFYEPGGQSGQTGRVLRQHAPHR